MAGPRSNTPGGLQRVKAGSNIVNVVGKQLELESSDDSVAIIANDTDKKIDLRVNATDAIFDCDTNVDVGDAVFTSSGGVLRKAKADSITTMPAIGYVTDKPTSSTCKIEMIFMEEGLTGISNNQKYFVSPTVAGELTTSVPIAPGYIMQMVGIGVDGTKRLININPANIVIRS